MGTTCGPLCVAYHGSARYSPSSRPATTTGACDPVGPQIGSMTRSGLTRSGNRNHWDLLMWSLPPIHFVEHQPSSLVRVTLSRQSVRRGRNPARPSEIDV